MLCVAVGYYVIFFPFGSYISVSFYKSALYYLFNLLNIIYDVMLSLVWIKWSFIKRSRIVFSAKSCLCKHFKIFIFSLIDVRMWFKSHQTCTSHFSGQKCLITFSIATNESSLLTSLFILTLPKYESKWCYVLLHFIYIFCHLTKPHNLLMFCACRLVLDQGLTKLFWWFILKCWNPAAVTSSVL